MFLRLVLHSKYETDGKSKICSERMDKHAIACIDGLRNENSFDKKEKKKRKKEKLTGLVFVTSSSICSYDFYFLNHFV